MTTAVCFRLTDDVFDVLVQLAKDMNVSNTEVVRQGIALLAKTHKQELADRQRLEADLIAAGFDIAEVSRLHATAHARPRDGRSK